MKKFFTDGFYKFLLGFSIIILISFGVLIFLGNQNAVIDDSQVDPTSQTAN